VTGTPGNWWTVFALVPDVFRHAVAGFGLYRSKRRTIDPKLRELGQARAGFTRGSQFVFSQHCKSARAVGLTEAQVSAIPAWATADVFSPVERAVLAYTDALVLDGGRVPDGTFAALRAALSEAIAARPDGLTEPERAALREHLAAQSLRDLALLKPSLLAEISNGNVTSVVDTGVNTGETWNYRVLSMGQHDGTWYVLGMTSVQTATIP